LNFIRKQKIALLLLTFILISTLTGQFKKTSTALEIDDSENYILDSGYWHIKVDDVEKYADGVILNGIRVTEGNSFSVTVEDIDEAWGIEFEFNNSTHSIIDYINNDEFLFEFSKNFYYPEEECKRIDAEGFDLEKTLSGPKMYHWFFLNPTDELWQQLDNFTTLEYHNSLPRENTYDSFLRADLELTVAEATFDLYMYGTFKNEEENIAIQFDHIMKFVWQKSTGILLGFRTASYFTGNYKNFTITEDMEMICRKSGYDLSAYRYISGFLPGFEVIICLVGFVVLLTIPKIIAKRKK